MRKSLEINYEKFYYQGQMDKEVRQKLKYAEFKIRNLENEECYALNKDGSVIINKGGNNNSIYFDGKEADLLINKVDVFTHNHPKSSSFSFTDFKTANSCEIERLRVISKKFSYEILFNSYLDENELFNLDILRVDKTAEWVRKISKRFDKAIERFLKKNNRKSLTKEEESFIFYRKNCIITHLVWKDLAKANKKFIYARWIL